MRQNGYRRPLDKGGSIGYPPLNKPPIKWVAHTGCMNVTGP